MIPHWLDSRHTISKYCIPWLTSTLLGAASMFYPIFCWVSSIRKVINKKVHRGKKSLFKKYLIPTNVILREGGKGWRVDIMNMFDISVSCQSPMSATQLSSSVSRMVGVSQSPGPVTGRRTAWMPVMKETVRQVILLSQTSQNNSKVSQWDISRGLETI